MKIHLDTDIGGDIDDLAALMMLLKWQGVELCGVTTMTEDKGKRAGFVKYVLQLAERMDIPVRAGADIAGGYYSDAPGFQGEIYWSEPIVPVQNPLDEALELLKASIEKNAVIVSTGQFTNLYLLAKKYPGILQSANLFLMGGSVFPSREGYPEPGNANDYNIQLDVTSAKYVFEHSNPTLVTLAVTLE